jgi:hypothetical protein
LDLKGKGQNISGAMTGIDIRQFRAGTLPPLDYGYDVYVGSLPKNWDRASVGAIYEKLASQKQQKNKIKTINRERNVYITLPVCARR